MSTSIERRGLRPRVYRGYEDDDDPAAIDVADYMDIYASGDEWEDDEEEGRTCFLDGGFCPGYDDLDCESCPYSSMPPAELVRATHKEIMKNDPFVQLQIKVADGLWTTLKADIPTDLYPALMRTLPETAAKQLKVKNGDSCPHPDCELTWVEEEPHMARCGLCDEKIEVGPVPDWAGPY